MHLRGAAWLVLGVALTLWPRPGKTDSFAQAYYDVAKNDLVITMNYRGTNPNHAFSLAWGPCSKSKDGAGHEIAADVLDSQWLDAASRDFVKTTRFNLANFRCRPATVTLRTAPRFFYTLQIPGS